MAVSKEFLPDEWKETCDFLQSMGFPEQAALQATQLYGTDLEAAVLYLSEGGSASSRGGSAVSAGLSAGPSSSAGGTGSAGTTTLSDGLGSHSQSSSKVAQRLGVEAASAVSVGKGVKGATFGGGRALSSSGSAGMTPHYRRQVLNDYGDDFDDQYIFEYLHFDVVDSMTSLFGVSPLDSRISASHQSATAVRSGVSAIGVTESKMDADLEAALQASIMDSGATVGSSALSSTTTSSSAAVSSSSAAAVSAVSASGMDGGVSSMMVDPIEQQDFSDELTLHKAAHAGDTFTLNQVKKDQRLFERAIRDHINRPDHFGNTPLHLAVRRITRADTLDASTTVHLLLELGANPDRVVSERGGCGYSPMQEACLRGDKAMVRDMLIHSIQKRGEEYELKKTELVERLLKLPDFELEIEWKVTSSLPMVESLIASRFGEMENFKIWKKGANIRFDSFVRGIGTGGVSKGHLSFLFQESGSITSIDHDLGTFENAIRKYKNPDFDELEYQIRVLMETEQGRSMMTSEDVKLSRKKDWLARDRSEKVGDYDCDVYGMSGLQFRVIGPHSDTSIRWSLPDFAVYFAGFIDEGLAAALAASETSEARVSDFDPPPPSAGSSKSTPASSPSKKSKKRRGSLNFLKKATAAVTSAVAATAGGSGGGSSSGSSSSSSSSSSLSGGSGKKGRRHRSKVVAQPTDIEKVDRGVDVVFWLSQSFPLSHGDMRTILEAVSIANDDIRRLTEIIKMDMARGGFPVRLDIPVIVGVTAQVTFCNFKLKSDLSDDLFRVPGHYLMR